MSGSVAPFGRLRALVVADDPEERMALCADLRRAGYDPVAFESCEGAGSWLDEETPAAAVVRVREGRLCGALLDVMKARGVALTFDGAPISALRSEAPATPPPA